MANQHQPFGPEEDARLTALVKAAKLSMAGIALQLASEGFPVRSRNSIIGRAGRLGIAPGQWRDKAAVRAQAQKPKAAGGTARSRVTKVTAKVAPASAPKPAAVAVPVRVVPAVEMCAPAPVGGMPIDEAGSRHCQWPLWGDAWPMKREVMFVCGAPVRAAGGPYCPACHGKAYQPAATRHPGGFVRRRAA